MFKKVFIIGLLSSLIFLYWCTKSNWFKYEFDNFYWTFNTETSFSESNTELNWLWYKILYKDIIKIYKQEWENKFSESIIISERNSDKSIQDFAKENIEDIEIKWFKPYKGKNVEIKCNENVYNLIYYQWKYSMNQYNIYLTYWFIKVNNKVYIVSYATPDEKNRNNFSSSLKELKCK